MINISKIIPNYHIIPDIKNILKRKIIAKIELFVNKLEILFQRIIKRNTLVFTVKPYLMFFFAGRIYSFSAFCLSGISKCRADISCMLFKFIKFNKSFYINCHEKMTKLNWNLFAISIYSHQHFEIICLRKCC